MMSSQYGLYTYGLVDRNPDQLDIVGIDKENKVYPVIEKGLCVMVSRVNIEQFQRQVQHVIAELTNSTDATQRETIGLLQAHEYVIEALMQDATVVPFKFGTILKDENAALQMLQDQEEHFKQLLAMLAGKVEWGLRVYADKQAIINYVEQRKQNQEVTQKSLSKGAAYLLGKQREEARKDNVAAQLAQVAEEIFQGVGNAACEAKINKTLSQKRTGKEKEMILNAAFLVEREKADHFSQQGGTFMEKYAFMRLDMEFSGPWPPYNFT